VAVELMLTGGRLEAERAHALGLVNRLVEPGGALSGALDLAFAICASAPASVEQLLTGLHEVDAAAEEVGWSATATAAAVLMGSPDRVEGQAAFVERRAPSWVPER
jgi:enoyl-CoA hydratase/carnithine racemase